MLSFCLGIFSEIDLYWTTFRWSSGVGSGAIAMSHFLECMWEMGSIYSDGRYDLMLYDILDRFVEITGIELGFGGCKMSLVLVQMTCRVLLCTNSRTTQLPRIYQKPNCHSILPIAEVIA